MKSPIPTRQLSVHAMAGFSLVELMVALTLSLILMAGALSILYSTKLTSAENERVARVQEAGRTAFELIMQDVRAAGYLGCTRPSVDNTTSPPTNSFTNGLSNNTLLLWNFGQPVYGFEATSATAWTPALDAVAIPASPAPSGLNDVLVLRASRPGSPVFRTNTPFAADAAIPVDRDPNVMLTIPPQTPMVISDCRGAAVFAATAFGPTGGTATISHGTGGTGAVNSDSALARTFDVDALVQPIQTVIYYIASCTAVGDNCLAVTPPALWQIVGNGAPQELVQGVEGMQLLYGVDTDGDLLANSYQKASDVADWTTVVSVNIAVLTRSIDETGVEVDKKTYSLLGGTAAGGYDYGPFNDRRQRAVFTTTITLRNGTT
jgi:type IV pilus assembly protein PilW